MNIAIIHLSDLHITSKDAIHMRNVNALIKSMQILTPFEGVIVAISGDIAAKGLNAEYTIASKFLGSIIKRITDTYSVESYNVKILLSPGNHDMNRNISEQLSREECLAYHRKGIDASHLSHELSRMKDFYSFAKSHLCFMVKSSPYLSRKILAFTNTDGSKEYIEANLINSEVFANDDDNGLHYLPEDFFDEFERPCRTKYSFAIMHRSPDWFTPQLKVRLNELIYGRCQLVLYGHEHYETSQKISLSKTNPSIIQCGGAWWCNNFDNSSYYGGILNAETGNYKQYEFTWNARKSFYEHRNEIDYIMQRQRAQGIQLIPNREFVSYIVSDEKHIVCHDIRKYFVFPNIKNEKSDDYRETQDIQSMEDLIKLVNSENELIIYGDGGSGKTTLARMLFLELYNEYTVLLCDISDIAGKNQNNIIRNVFGNIYNSEDVALFEQQERSKKIVIIDGFDSIKSEHLSKFLPDLANKFEHIILIGEKHKADDFDMRRRLKDELQKEKIKEVAIDKFFADKRMVLIERIVNLSIENNRTLQSQLVIQIENALTLQGFEYQLDPDFIVKFSSYYSQHIQELHMSNANVFSKVFEASIELSIREHLRKETIGQVKTALGEVAHYVHFNKKYPICESEIETIVQAYCEKYDETLLAARFLEIVKKANILVRESQGLAYRFKNKDHLSYFVAEAVIRHFNEGDENAESNLNEIIEYSCFSINPTILKFITYTSGNIRIVDLLLQQAKSYVAEWPEYDAENAQLKYLAATPEFEQKISSQARAEEVAARANREKAIEQAESAKIEIVDIYDYDISDIDKINNQLIRAHLQMNSISGCLVTFGHILPARLKNDLMETLYKMPNQIFYRWANMIDATIEGLIGEFANQEDNSEEIGQDTIEKILGTIQKISIITLINLYYGIARNGATSATIELLKRDKYIVSYNHELERLMFLEQTDQWNEFIANAADLNKRTKSGMIKTMIRSMVRHMLIWSSTLPRDKRDHLISVYRLQDSRQSILLQSARTHS